MIGLIFIAPLINGIVRRGLSSRIDKDSSRFRIITAITDSFGISLGAVIAVWPVIACSFGIFSIVGPLATFVISPALIFIIVLGSITGMAGLINPQVSQVIGWTSWLFLTYMLWSVKAFASMPLSALNIALVNHNFMWIYYSFLFLFLWIKTNFGILKYWGFDVLNSAKSGITISANLLSKLHMKYVIIPLLVLASLTCLTAASMPDKNLHVSFFDVGQGDAIFIQSGNQSILIDGGPGSQAVCLGLGNKMPYWDRSINLIILTHPHLDHLSGLIETINRYKVDQILVANIPSVTSEYQEWLRLIEDKNIPYALAQPGQKIKLGNEVSLNFLWPSDTSSANPDAEIDNNGIIARLIYSKISFLFMADNGHETESRLIRQRFDLSSTVLKVGHHGSATSTSPEFLSITQPQIAVISVSSDNHYGHPDAKVLENLKNIKVYRTDESGTVEFITDGERLFVKTER